MGLLVLIRSPRAELNLNVLPLFIFLNCDKNSNGSFLQDIPHQKLIKIQKYIQLAQTEADLRSASSFQIVLS